MELTGFEPVTFSLRKMWSNSCDQGFCSDNRCLWRSCGTSVVRRRDLSKPNHRGIFVAVAIQGVSPVRVAVREGRAVGGDGWTVFRCGESDHVAAEHVVRYQATRLTRVQMISGNPDQGRAGGGVSGSSSETVAWATESGSRLVKVTLIARNRGHRRSLDEIARDGTGRDKGVAFAQRMSITPRIGIRVDRSGSGVILTSPWPLTSRRRVRNCACVWNWPP